MSESAKSKNDVPPETSIPAGGASLESILCTEELHHRPWRPRDHDKENRALVALASAFAAESRDTILQTLTETILQVTGCDSSGLSLLTTDEGSKRFYWPAVAGMWKAHVGGGTPRNFGPCGDVLDHNRALLFRHFERRYPYLPVAPPAEECLLVPFYIADKAVGTIWAIMHSDRHKFDAEDERLMNVLGQFASLAYQTLATINDLKLQVAAREKAETALSKLASGLEAKVRRLVKANADGLRAVSRRLVEVQEAERRSLANGLHDLVGQKLTALNINLSIVKSALMPSTTTPVVTRLEDSLRLVEETIESIRDVMTELRPAALDDFGLASVLRGHAEQFARRTGVAAAVAEHGPPRRLAPDVEVALFRIAQEALANVAKYAAAREATITLEGTAQTVFLTIADNGRGFDATTAHQPARDHGWGMTIMRERAAAVGGVLSVESAAGRGTRVMVAVPVPTAQSSPKHIQKRGR